MLAVADRTPWAILGVLFGRILNIMIKVHGGVHMNAPLHGHIPAYHSNVAILEG